MAFLRLVSDCFLTRSGIVIASFPIRELCFSLAEVLVLVMSPKSSLPFSPLSTTSGPQTETALTSSSGTRELSWRVASSLLVSFRYAWAGVRYAFRTQRNFRIHVIIGSLALSLAFILQIDPVEVVVISLTIGFVLAMELLNTAIESAIDLTIRQKYHDLAKIAKDCAAAAVLISALVSMIVASILLLPPLMIRLQLWLGG